MDAFISNDGSPILYNEKYGEYYHSKSGAIDESVKKYVLPCRIPEIAKAGTVRILDIGFGLGYNAVCAIGQAMESNKGCEIEIISLEIDRSIIEEAKKLTPNLEFYSLIKKLEFDPLTESYSYEDKQIYLKIKIGDAVKTIRSIGAGFDAVFLDGFSPSKNPELWSLSFIGELASRMKKGAILATYSYAKSVRQNLSKAGLDVKDGPIVSRRSPSTYAIKSD